MEAQTQAPTNHLYEILPDGRWKIRFDHHMVNQFSICEQLFAYQHVPGPDGLVLRAKGGMSYYASFGIWWAHVMEDWYEKIHAWQDNWKAQGVSDLSLALDDKYQLKPAPTKNNLITTAVLRWFSDDMDRFALIAPQQYSKFCGGFLQIQLPDGTTKKFPSGAVDFASQYYDYSMNMNDFTNWKVIAVESTFGLEGDVVVAESPNVVVAYQGRPDLMVFDEHQGCIEPVDDKTTGRMDEDFTTKWKPNAQITGYAVAAEELCKQLKIDTKVRSCVINGAARDIPTEKPRNGGPPKPRFQRVRIPYTDYDLDTWKAQMVRKAERLRYCIEHDAWQWRESACHFQYGSGCEYLNICSKGSEQDKLTVINSHYQRVPPWTPKGE